MLENSPRTAIVDKLAKLLTSRRLAKGISLHELSQKAGLGRTTVSYIERGIRSPSFDSLIRIAEVLEIELWKLVKDAGSTVRKVQKSDRK